MIRHLSILAAAALIACGAAAQGTSLHYREGQRVDPQDVARILGAKSAPKTRSIRLLNDPDAHAQNDAPAASLSLPVRFGFDSADIQPGARPQLDALAEGIKMLPAGAAVMVEGHTDGVGGEAYNLQLSQRRAVAVKEYLVRHHNIDEKRLLATGVGKQRPIEGADPLAPENRRVQFRGM